MIKIAPSLLSADFADLKNELQTIQEADYLHLDVMDGHFVPNLSIGPMIVKALRPHSDLVFDVHLMLTNPRAYVGPFAAAGADIITIHAECLDPVSETLKEIKDRGIRCGIVLSPDTPCEAMEPYLPLVDMVLLMSVYPGFGGQKFIERSIKRLQRARELMGTKMDLQIDGGITSENAARVIEAGANVLVAGTSVFGAANRSEAIRKLRQ